MRNDGLSSILSLFLSLDAFSCRDLGKRSEVAIGYIGARDSIGGGEGGGGVTYLHRAARRRSPCVIDPRDKVQRTKSTDDDCTYCSAIALRVDRAYLYRYAPSPFSGSDIRRRVGEDRVSLVARGLLLLLLLLHLPIDERGKTSLVAARRGSFASRPSATVFAPLLKRVTRE